MWKLLVVMVALTACSKKDDCQRVFDKSKPMLEEMAKQSGRKVDAVVTAGFLEKCRKAVKAGHRDPVMDCVLGAKDEAAVRACYDKQVGAYRHASKAVEARLQLGKLAKDAKVAAVTNGEFPKGKAGPTPATACCAGPGGKCAVTHDWASSPVWSALDFQIDEPNRFQYSYESDGKTFTATAVGDLDCDGTSITYKAEGTIANGNPSVKLTEPPPGSD